MEKPSNSSREPTKQKPQMDLTLAGQKKGACVETVELLIEGYSSITITKQTLLNASPYFATLLKYNEERILMTPPPNVQPDRYVSLLRSVSYNLPPTVDECNMWDYLVLARYFLMKPLEDTCKGVIRQALRTMTMDEFCRFWRKARAEQCGDMEKWFLAGIVRNLDQAQTLEFLNFGVEELMALLSDDEFLPLFEEPVYKAIIDWCEYLPEQRMTRDILEMLLAEIVWDQFDSNTIRALASSTTPPLRSVLEEIATNAAGRKKPKRAVERHLIFGHEMFVERQPEKPYTLGSIPTTSRVLRTRQLLHWDGLRGTLGVWNAPAARPLCSNLAWRYVTHNLQVGQPTVLIQKRRDLESPGDVMAIVNLVDGEARVIGKGLPGGYFMDVLMGGYNVSPNWCHQNSHGFLGMDLVSKKWERREAPVQCKGLHGVSSCSLQLPEGECIAHMLTITRWIGFSIQRENVIGFHRLNDFFSAFVRLPAVPTACHGAAMVQCGTFLFVTGGSNGKLELLKQCYRLDLTMRNRWERIGDLSVPRVDHCMFVKSGRVFVYGGSTLDGRNKKVAVVSFETYDPYADMWTVFNIPLTGEGQGEMDVGCIEDTEQTTYCLDLGASLDETKYRDIDDPIYYRNCRSVGVQL